MKEPALVAISILLLTFATSIAEAQNAPHPALPPVATKAAVSPAEAILHVIEAQQAAWNRHDLDGFMAGYWNSPELTFFSGGTVSHGWQAAHDRYVKRYQSEGRSMGQLEFRELKVEMLDGGRDGTSAFVRGEYHLIMPDGTTPHGIFTLVFRKFRGTGAASGWKIVHDHSSAE